MSNYSEIDRLLINPHRIILGFLFWSVISKKKIWLYFIFYKILMHCTGFFLKDLTQHNLEFQVLKNRWILSQLFILLLEISSSKHSSCNSFYNNNNDDFIGPLSSLTAIAGKLNYWRGKLSTFLNFIFWSLNTS